MDVESFDREITDHALAVLLRYFSSISRISLGSPVLAIERDRELLRLHWALSEPVSTFAEYVLNHRHEIQTVLGSAVRIEDGTVRGRLNALATMKLRQVSGLATALVSHEPIRSYVSGPNQLLGWVLTQAWWLASRFSTVTLDSQAYRLSTDAALQRLEACRRLYAVAQISGQTMSRRPTAAALVEAGRSRRLIYRLAAKAYSALVDVEAGNPETITTMLQATLLGPLESWRRFEMAIGLSVAEGLAAAQDKRLSLNLLLGDSRWQMARAGRFAVYWQSRTSYYSQPEAEPSEVVLDRILGNYGLSSGADRPDLVVTDEARNEVAAIVEVKYLTGEDGSDRVRTAMGQLVRYARGYARLAECGPLLGRSVVALSQGIDAITVPSSPLPGLPSLTDFKMIKRGFFFQWAQKLCASQPA